MVDALLRLPDGRTATGQLDGLGARDVTILCEARGTPPMEPGGRVQIILRGAAVGGEHEAVGHVERDMAVDDLRRITVQYLDAQAFRDLVDGGLGRLFNRRGAYRVRPSTRLPVEAELSGAARAGRDEVRLMDLSVTGAAMVVAAQAGGALHVGDAVDLTLHLPTSPHPLTVGCRVRNVVAQDEGVRLGLDMDPFRTPDFEDAQDRVRDYIMRRQREMLRARHLRSAD